MAKTITGEIKKIERAIATIEKFRESEPAGSLNETKVKGALAYRQKIPNGDGTYKIEYLKKDDKRLGPLAKKKYYSKEYPVIKDELKALRVQEKHYHPRRKYEIYDELGELKKYVKPLFVEDQYTKEQMIKDSIDSWLSKGESMTFYDEGKNIVTDDGNKVRSKSEALIYNQLLQQKRRLHFRYEQDLTLPGSFHSIRPDFEIISIATGEVYYWEHVGMLGYEEYAEKFITKINNYYMAGYYPGEKLILTFESANSPIDTRAVKRLIENYFPLPEK